MSEKGFIYSFTLPTFSSGGIFTSYNVRKGFIYSPLPFLSSRCSTCTSTWCRCSSLSTCTPSYCVSEMTRRWSATSASCPTTSWTARTSQPSPCRRAAISPGKDKHEPFRLREFLKEYALCPYDFPFPPKFPPINCQMYQHLKLY